MSITATPPTLTDIDIDLNLSALEHLLEATAGVPELFASHLAGESDLDRQARLAAAADIAETLLADHPAGLGAGVEELAQRTGVYVDLIEHQARERVATWIPGTEVAA